MSATTAPATRSAMARLTSGSTTTSAQRGRAGAALIAPASCGLYLDGSFGLRHQQSQLGFGAILDRALARDASGVHHQHAIGEGEDLFQLARDEQDGAAGGAKGAQLAMDEFD